MEKIKRTFSFIRQHPLSKKHFLRSLFRFAYWQVQKRLNPGNAIVKTFIKPVKFYARTGLAGITGNIYTGLHEFEAMGFLLHLLREEDNFLDVGANVGSFTLLAAGNCRATGIAIEPIPAAFKLLKENINLNQLQDYVTLINAGAGDVRGTLLFTDGQDTTNHVIMTEEVFEKSLAVPMVIIDEVFDKIPLLAKIDVEGFESRVLNGMKNLLKKEGFKALIIEMSNSTNYGFDDNYTHELLTSHGFSPYTYEPFERVLKPVKTFDYENIIYCRDLAFISDRLATAAKIKVMGEQV